ncbi:MAG: aminotransferase class III-fold pyridoxal phosphate-dependent enzyme [Deltaproteobacteria bacterium]|nr:MAG: aminotransferase class III-fold pyridoxal phosphate-dependent enzyme [Deltaproteobacteria bacterium]
MKLTQKDDQDFAKEKLAQFYANDLIPAEKKHFLTDLKESFGPYLGVEARNGETNGLMDAASQIATLGLGFNPSIFFGVAHHLEAHLNDKSSPHFKKLRKSFEAFLKRKTGWENQYATFANSGAEANEIALGFAYKKRVNKNAKKVLAFKGSFHGRMQITLSSTWNPSKREPFEWPDFLTLYSPFPSMVNNEICRPHLKGWEETWSNAPAKDFCLPENWEYSDEIDLKDWKDADLIAKEVKSLTNVREHLLTGEVYAIIVEPMQCEGGDHYGSNRFFKGLLLLAKSFRVPIIFDEVQTGFHLGREFFWHKMFELDLEPDYLICAKKAQIGIVLSHEKNDIEEEYSVVSTIRGYLHGFILDQFQEQIIELENKVHTRLDKFIERFSKYIERPRAMGLAFAFDVIETEYLDKLIRARFDHSLLYYPAGAKTLRFRLNLGYRSADLDYLFNNLISVFMEVYENAEYAGKTLQVPRQNMKPHYDRHEFLLDNKLSEVQGRGIDKSGFEKLKLYFEEKHQCNLHLVDKELFDLYQDKIQILQNEVYEKARQTDIKNFKNVIYEFDGLALLAEHEGEIRGITFASPMYHHPLERGLRRDSYFEDKKTLYMIDTTVSPDYQGKGMGRDLKYAFNLMADLEGFERIHGRNRDRLAAYMLKINFSLGAIENYYISEDYPDFSAYRDVICYSQLIRWKKPQLNLSQGPSSPLGIIDLNMDFIKKRLPVMVNKVCLSNVVSESFLTDVKDILSLLPEDLRHGYTTSGQSECVDKLVKSIWYKYKTSEDYPKNNKLLTFSGHYFGEGSALARSLSLADDPYFPVQKLNAPSGDNDSEILSQVENELKNGTYHSVWIEPIMQKIMYKVSLDFLNGLRSLCDKYKVPLVFNETASSVYRYSNENYFISHVVKPDCGFSFLGGQAGICFLTRTFFLPKPLMLISTWDGDEFSFGAYVEVMKKVNNNHQEFIALKEEFNAKLQALLAKYPIRVNEISGGIGYFEGDIPTHVAELFKPSGAGFIVCPSRSSMEEFINE